MERLVVHVGTNDISKQESELLKLDFIHLLTLLQTLKCHAYISGPLPTLGRGVSGFSRLLSLHTWLSSACGDYGVTFIDNLNLFWERRQLYWRDGLHPKRAGSRMITANLSYCLYHSHAPPLIDHFQSCHALAGDQSSSN